jgi:hypothetical protein
MVVQSQFLRAYEIERMRQRFIQKVGRHQSLVREHRKVFRRVEDRLAVLENQIEHLSRARSKQHSTEQFSSRMVDDQ